MKPNIIKIAIPGLTINARVWGPESGIRVLAMHGWLDNAATFDLLAPLLSHCRIVSVDFPGHGFSDHLPPGGIYHHEDRVIQMFHVADALGWEKFNILGHSMGGIIGTIMAAVLPERIEKIGVIDVIPFLKVFHFNLTKAIRAHLESATKIPSSHEIYSSQSEAASKRATISLLFPMNQESALALAEGGMAAVNGGYVWTFDMRLLLPNFMAPTDEIVVQVLEEITAKYCLVAATEGLVSSITDYKEKLWPIKHLQIHEIPGGHHIQLDDPQSVAVILNHFF